MNNFKIYQLRNDRWQVTAINSNSLSQSFIAAILWRSFATYCDAEDFLAEWGVI